MVDDLIRYDVLYQEALLSLVKKVLGEVAQAGLPGDHHFYVTFRTEDGWTELANLGPEVNSFANEYGATLSPDGEYLFFTSDRRPPADIYRVAVAEIAAMRRN